MNITESIKFDKLKEENEKLKEEIKELNEDLNWSLKSEKMITKMMEGILAENQVLKNQLAEKDKEIMELKNWIQNGGCHQNIQKFIDNLDKEISELKQQQLYKEDFDNIDIQKDIHNFTEVEWNYFQQFNFFVNSDDLIRMFVLKDPLKYDKLPSKEDKYD